jgi:reactive chlorine resistance protein C
MRLERLGSQLLRYALAGILIYLGAFKFTSVEAHAIQPLLAHSPLFGWAYGWLSMQAVSNLIGVTEMVLGGLIAMRRPFPRLAALGSLGAIGVFMTTLSFLFTTPGVWAWVEMFPLPVPSEAGGFLLKDVFLLGAAAWSAGEAWRAATPPSER